MWNTDALVAEKQCKTPKCPWKPSRYAKDGLCDHCRDQLQKELKRKMREKDDGMDF